MAERSRSHITWYSNLSLLPYTDFDSNLCAVKMINSNKSENQNLPRLGFALIGAIATFTMSLSAIGVLGTLQSVQAFETATVTAKQKQSETKVVKIAGTYKTVFTPEFLVDAKKQGLASISGQWTIKPNGAYEAFVNANFTSGKVQTIKTTGKVSIRNGKMFSQVETVDGKKPKQVPPTQSYTLLADGKTLQADGQPVKLVKQ